MVYRIIAKQKNLNEPSCEIPHYMNEKGGWRKMKCDHLEIGSKSLAWFILKGIIENFIEYTHENEGEWSILITRTNGNGKSEQFYLASDNYNYYWDSNFSNWLA